MMSVAMGMAAIAVLAVAAQAQESQRFIRFELAGDVLSNPVVQGR